MKGIAKARLPLGDLRAATIVERLNRFVAIVEVGGSRVRAHVADSGRLKELVYPGNTAMVRKARDPEGRRSTSHDLVLTSAEILPDGTHRWVSVDTRYPNKLFGLALSESTIPVFRGYEKIHPECYYDHHRDLLAGAQGQKKAPRSRLDFMLSGRDLPHVLIEVKSVTLSVDGVGLFPDAPTTRGTRHLKVLSEAVSRGYKAYAVFIAQRQDIVVVKPNQDTDPNFAAALKEAQTNGVGLLGFRCSVTPQEIALDGSTVPVEVD